LSHPLVSEPLAALRALFDAALAAADPERVLPAQIPASAALRTVVVGAGKAAAKMARAVERSLPEAPTGLVVTRYGHGVPCTHIEVVEAAHPVPDAPGRAAAERILTLARSVRSEDRLICLISGGASAVLALPAAGLTLADKQAVTRALLRSGATIQEMNCVRKHLSAIKGGRLAAACRGEIVTLAISDVVGDDPAVIGSGPTVPDPTTFADARGIVAKYGIDAPAPVVRHLAQSTDETPKPGDPRLARASFRLVAAPRLALEAAARRANELDIRPIVLGDAIEGEAREIGAQHARMALDLAAGSGGVARSVLLSGGETTVTVSGAGKGGRNTEYLLGAALALDGAPGIYALACDTDGIDGSEDSAGAIVRPDTLTRARTMGMDAAQTLAANDSWTLFRALGDLVVTGPTLTNVNDFRAILVL
jgi:hydroxypyruvate reductase